MFKNKKSKIIGLTLVVSSAAYAFPWDIDMVDSVSYRGYEWKMLPTPEGAASQDNEVFNEYSPWQDTQLTRKGYRDFKLTVDVPDEEDLGYKHSNFE